jgi:hypothetical protein
MPFEFPIKLSYRSELIDACHGARSRQGTCAEARAARGCDLDDVTHLSPERWPTSAEDATACGDIGGGIDMAKVFVEARPEGRPEGSPIDDFIVEKPRG